jgi:Ulp1 family protease
MYDCGIYLLHFVEVFAERGKELIASVLAGSSESENDDLWRKGEVQALRKKLFELILALHDQYEDHSSNTAPPQSPPRC